MKTAPRNRRPPPRRQVFQAPDGNPISDAGSQVAQVPWIAVIATSAVTAVVGFLAVETARAALNRSRARATLPQGAPQPTVAMANPEEELRELRRHSGPPGRRMEGDFQLPLPGPMGVRDDVYGRTRTDTVPAHELYRELEAQNRNLQAQIDDLRSQVHPPQRGSARVH